MSKPGYTVKLNDLFTAHGRQSNKLLHDVDMQLNKMEVQALVASGDCLVTIATEIDAIAELLTRTDPKHIKLELEKLTQILLHLQQYYKIVPQDV